MVRIIHKSVPFLILAFIVVVVYFPAFRTFFQQDEWNGFGGVYTVNGRSLVSLVTTSFTPNIGHYVPFSKIAFESLFFLFGLNFHSWFLVSLSWHLGIVVILYLLAQRLFKNDYLSLVASLLFAISASGDQATLWTVTDINTHGATFFALLSLIYFFDYVKNTKRYKNLVLQILFLFISLGFKEIAIGFFLLYPFSYFIFAKKKDFSKIKYSSIMLLLGLLYIGSRVLMYLFPNTSGAPVVFESQPLSVFIYNLITFPFKALSQTIVPPNIFLLVGKIIPDILIKHLGLSRGTMGYDIFIEKVVLEALFIIVFALIIGGIITLYKKRSVNFKIIFFAFLFIVLNSLIYAFSPARAGIITFIDSRNLYFITIGMSLLITALVKIIYRKIRLLSYLIISVLFVLNICWLRMDLGYQEKVGSVRKNILTQIKKDYPNLPPKTIFYTESDSSFYGLAESERIMPFQSGFGQTLLVWYQEREKFPKEFFINNYLWGIKNQEYKVIENRGFGYFRDFDKLVQTVGKEGVSVGSIIAFRYDSEQQVLENMTREIRGRLRGYLINKKEISFSVNSLINSNDVRLMIDKKRETYWSSKVPYIYPLSIILDMRTSRKIAQITIDSYNNKDQNAVGYKVSISADRQKWKEVFYSRRYPPNDGGIVNLYFEPTNGKFIKVEQIGEHKFAPWVIHEIKAYEAVN